MSYEDGCDDCEVCKKCTQNGVWLCDSCLDTLKLSAEPRQQDIERRIRELCDTRERKDARSPKGHGSIPLAEILAIFDGEATEPRPPATNQPSKCPTCGSPDYALMPLTGRDDEETRHCRDAFHKPDPAEPRPPAAAVDLRTALDLEPFKAIVTDCRRIGTSKSGVPWSKIGDDFEQLIAEIERLRVLVRQDAAPSATEDERPQELLEGNWHAIEGPNGMCACGPMEGCPERLERWVKGQVDFWQAKANFLERERERTLAELPDAWQRVPGSLAAKVKAMREFFTAVTLHREERP